MILKLQKKTLVKSQIIGYVVTLFIGTLITLSTIQLYFDTKPLLEIHSDVFSNKSAVISKKVSVFKTINKDKIYFTNDDIKELKTQTFTKNVSKFNNASFKVKAFSNESENIPIFQTDLFFESIPNEYVDVEAEKWQWKKGDDFIPIVIPESYLKLYNFGFAESQSLPVLSKSTISKISFNIKVIGNGQSQVFRSRIVGFSTKINSILVPEKFLTWANSKFGRPDSTKTSRLLVDFKNPSDEKILDFFNANSYSINKDKLELSKLTFFYKSALLFVLIIAGIIIILSVAFILLSVNLIIQKNKELILNLYNIGYNHKKIAKFYQITISITTIASIVGAIIVSYIIRTLYLKKISKLFDFEPNGGILLFSGIIVLLILLLLYNTLLMKNIKKIVIPKKW